MIDPEMLARLKSVKERLDAADGRLTEELKRAEERFNELRIGVRARVVVDPVDEVHLVYGKRRGQWGLFVEQRGELRSIFDVQIDRHPLCGHDGGRYVRGNIVPACVRCNAGRCSRTCGIQSRRKPCSPKQNRTPQPSPSSAAIAPSTTTGPRTSTYATSRSPI